ncbi:MAG TPA: cysteine-rich CWC family protein [Bradyrhizobium sp.]|nr:cysteine-rich CWC family protein [Bradyrhizobium sp.]
MTNRKEFSPQSEIKCSSCGTAFGCNPQGPCWCAEETVRLPMPENGAGCLCPSCLRKLARQQHHDSATPRAD